MLTFAFVLVFVLILVITPLCLLRIGLFDGVFVVVLLVVLDVVGVATVIDIVCWFWQLRTPTHVQSGYV